MAQGHTKCVCYPPGKGARKIFGKFVGALNHRRGATGPLCDPRDLCGKNHRCNTSFFETLLSKNVSLREGKNYLPIFWGIKASETYTRGGIQHKFCFHAREQAQNSVREPYLFHKQLFFFARTKGSPKEVTRDVAW